MSDEQPRAEWIFPEEKKSNAGRVWLIIGLSIAALIIVAVVLFFIIPRGTTPDPEPSASPTATPSPSASETTEPEPSPTPVTTPPPVPDPDLDTFAAEVQPRLDDATRGLDLVANNLDVGAQIVESLQQDAEILSGAAAPSSIADVWSTAVADYASKLSALHAAIDDGSEPQAALDAARSSLSALRGVVGL